jgi:hypothetical protein
MKPPVVAIAIVCLAAGCFRALPQDVPSGPDELAWRLFSRANSQKGKPWDKWTEALNLLDPARTPMLTSLRAMGYDPDIQNMLIALETIKNGTQLKATLAKLSGLNAQPGAGKLQRFYNDALVTAIKGPELNTLKGRKDAFQKGALINLGSTTVAVKVLYRVVKPEDANKYYISSPGSNYGVVAFHLTARIYPQWIWATWEHSTVAEMDKKSGTGYCCSDNFGWDDKNQGASLPLKKLMENNDVLDVWWKNYRLVGTQIYSIDSIGDPEKLGNFAPEMEGTILQHSSCITCHARAAFDVNGMGQKVGTFVGAPNPNWYKPGGKLTHLQLDFLWTLIADVETERLLNQRKINLLDLR